MLVNAWNITIDHRIGAPFCGRKVIYGLIATDNFSINVNELR